MSRTCTCSSGSSSCRASARSFAAFAPMLSGFFVKLKDHKIPVSIKEWLTLLEAMQRSEEHTSELQSHSDLVCRLLLEKKQTPTSPPDEPRAARASRSGGCAAASRP